MVTFLALGLLVQQLVLSGASPILVSQLKFSEPPRFFCIEVGLFLPTYKAILAVVGRFPRTALIRVGTTYSYHATGLCASETVPGFISKRTMLGFSGDCVS